MKKREREKKFVRRAPFWVLTVMTGDYDSTTNNNNNNNKFILMSGFFFFSLHSHSPRIVHTIVLSLNKWTECTMRTKYDDNDGKYHNTYFHSSVSWALICKKVSFIKIRITFNRHFVFLRCFKNFYAKKFSVEMWLLGVGLLAKFQDNIWPISNATRCFGFVVMLKLLIFPLEF